MFFIGLSLSIVPVGGGVLSVGSPDKHAAAGVRW
ncbi:hypothetical protein STVIR_3942 [Streptomyces viridochromogenes Tue57]|uniref:Uncharacterized protein n=1 Tax=Streptomyces viridochromogenes Tue57 TaxID=1160705 RepID=L8PF52_STRVR|nr:hypothetical protein STVIR_3942 [Streptomyces viridochromogenes Tue57]